LKQLKQPNLHVALAFSGAEKAPTPESKSDVHLFELFNATESARRFRQCTSLLRVAFKALLEKRRALISNYINSINRVQVALTLLYIKKPTYAHTHMRPHMRTCGAEKLQIFFRKRLAPTFGSLALSSAHSKQKGDCYVY
jgi:hypothetical protein